MDQKDIVRMTGRELRRLKVVQAVLERRLVQREAAELVGLSERQVRRLVKRVREQGEVGVIHRSRGRSSNRRMSDRLKKKVLWLYRHQYWDFGPTLAAEKLWERDQIKISRETLRVWLLAERLWRRRRKRSRYRCWRERKPCFGQMVQMDGSHHDWLEGRGPQVVLMGYIDDATNTVFARFYDYEGTLPALDSFRRYIRQYGIPQSVYVDTYKTYRATKRLTVEEQLRGVAEPQSQFERALGELGVEVIHAHSPQAKGRIERLFGTFQDRLIKEMRLAGVCTLEGANRFLRWYLPKYNRRFSLRPKERVNLHHQIPRGLDLDSIFSVREERVVRKDFTLVYHGQWYQIEEPPVGVRMKAVTIEQRLDGRRHILYHGRELKYRKIPIRPSRPKEQKATRLHRPYIPPPDHPWRRFQISSETGEKQPLLTPTE